MPSKPLDKFPGTRTTRLDEMREAITIAYGDNNLDLQRAAGGFDGYSNHCALNNIALTYASFGTGVVQEFREFKAFAQQFRLRGGSEINVNRTMVRLSNDQALVFSPGPSRLISHSSDMEHCVLRIDQIALLKKLSALVGRQPKHPLEFEPISDARTPEALHFRRLFLFLVEQLSSPSGIPPLALAELEQAVIVSFLCANRHSESQWLTREPKRVAPWQVRRAEEYIEANWDQPITVEALAIATRVSARSLFHFFKKSRGYSPMAFVKKIRLQHARKELSLPHEGASITRVALACGFNNLGHFAADYGKTFGELPSETLARAKGGNGKDE